jgi:predicted dehydrogenase
MMHSETKIQSTPIKVAIIGYGWWGNVLSSLIKKNSLFEIVLVIDNNPEAKAKAEKCGFKTADNLDAALENPAVDAIFLCTPHSEHAYQLLACAFSNKHTYCEKPLCPTLSEALKAIKLFDQKNLILGIGHDLRFNDSIIQLLDSIKNRSIGKIIQIDAVFSHDKFLDLPKNHWRLSELDSPVGPLSSGGMHLIDLIISILGPAKSVMAKLSNVTNTLPNGDSLSIMLNFSGGETALINSLLTTQFDNRITIYGSKGWTEARENTHKENPGEWTLHKNVDGHTSVKKIKKLTGGIEENINAFGNAILKKYDYPINSNDILYGIAAYEGIINSVKTGRNESIVGVI